MEIINRASCVKYEQDENIFTWKLSKYIIIIKVKEMESNKDKEPSVEDSMTQRVSVKLATCTKYVSVIRYHEAVFLHLCHMTLKLGHGLKMQNTS